MKNNYLIVLLSFSSLLWFTGCAGSKFGAAKKGEKVVMAAPPKRDVINFALLKKQGEEPMTLASRGAAARGAASFTGSLVSIGVSAVKEVINKEHKKYLAEWKQGLKDMYFYDQPSAEGPFDPTGMQFNGFNITRTFKDENNKIITALSADFEVDKDSVPSNEIINDGIFRLKLKNIKIDYSKAKVPEGRDTVNIDFKIIFTASFISRDGKLFRDEELGSFMLRLRKAPLDSTFAGYHEYYEKLKNKQLEGKCFIVPRSYGHYKTADNRIISLYNQGMFSIAVNVTECSKDSFINEMLIKTSDAGLDYLQDEIQNLLNSKLGSN